MNTILVLGAGRSSSALITYLLKEGKSHDWQIVVADKVLSMAEDALKGVDRGKAINFDLNNEQTAHEVIKSADVVISMLPPFLHAVVARLCLVAKKHLLTASYVSDDMKNLDTEVRFNNLLFLNECGLDPGIDHMSAMQIINKIRSEEGEVTSFESFTGGLIAPETDPENPWRYKFTWNPANVVTAGKDGAIYIKDGEHKHVGYKSIFKEVTPVAVPKIGEFEGYPNRDSLKYIALYDLNNISTMQRGTLRSKGFCSAWNVLVQLGCCDVNTELATRSMTHYDFINSFVNTQPGKSLEDSLLNKVGVNENDLRCLRWSGLFDNELVGIQKGTPAQILEHILMKKWKLDPTDKDMIVMWHRLRYEQNGTQREIQSSLVVKGENSIDTAMARTVGLPLGIVTKLLIENKIQQRGVCIPTDKQFYEPVLDELKLYGITFEEWFA